MEIKETKMDQETIDKFLVSYCPSWHHANNLAFINDWRIFFLWNPWATHADIVSIEKQVIYAKIRCFRTLNEFNFSVFYGLYTNGDRDCIWSAVINFCGQVELFLISGISGDFNCVMSPEERTGGTRPTPNKESRTLVDMCALLGIQDVTAMG